ncbi:hypothetical protein Glove_366g4 [Diversispora epigaea]|uniref:DNA 3'-5' helicase n=1 Tax=Diversispora epigaea TaxID=1348612 RepID=A0A397H7B8_9GLOM|nr:hypothetical protein Glove_366g4 [Diversispora epigaea]
MCDLYALTTQPIHHQQKVFEEITNEVHYILDQEHFRDSWSYLCNIKKIFPNSLVLLLSATYKITEVQEILSYLNIDHQQMSLIRDKHFGSNSIIFQVIKKKDNKEQFLETIFKIIGEVEIANEKSSALLSWKSEKVYIIVATNAFGMKINKPDVRVVIHAVFPMSMSNLIQESGRAGRDGLLAKAIIMFNRKDIRTVMGVYSGGYVDSTQEQQNKHNDLEILDRIKYLSNAKHKIREVLFYCFTIYQCLDKPIYVDVRSDMEKMLEVINVITKTKQQITKNNIIDIFRQSQTKNVKNQAFQECNICDNCIRRIVDKPIYVDVRSDMEKMLEVINVITKTKQQITKNNIIDIFRQSQTKNVKIEENIILNRSSIGNYSCSVFILGLVENAFEKANAQNWNYLIKTK